MVKSLLDDTINYPETKLLDKADKDFEASIYEISLFDMDVMIALGQPKYSFVERNIIYYPIYLVKNKKVDIQIGLYEIKSSDLPSLIDEDGDINLALLNEPLLYSFVDKNLILGIEVIAIEDDMKEKIYLKEQTAADAQQERTEFDKKDKSVTWIQRFMKNKNYGIVENEGAGDCLFAVIRDGLQTAGKNVSVKEMRQLLADNATHEMLEIYTTLYVNAQVEDTELKTVLKELTARNKTLKEKIKTTTDRAVLTTIIKQAEDVQKKNKEIKLTKSYTEDMLREFAFMKGVKTLEQLKAKIQTCEFWGNTWAISTLERALNVKLIILSEEYYNSDDKDHVLQCGQLNDDVVDDFTPSHYVIANHQGNHYQLITYKEYGAFTFKELPYDIKMLIVDKCMERLAGPYYIIPDFRALNEKIKFFVEENEEPKAQAKAPKEQSPKPKAQAQQAQAQQAQAQQAQAQQTQAQQAQAKQSQQQQPPVELLSDLYNNSTVFQFYLGSMDKPLPGSGAGESMGPEGLKEYDDLKKITSWRKMLSNSWPAVFILDGHKWLSVEHYYQGSKFKRQNKDYYLLFSLDSNSELSQNQAMAEGAGGNGKYQGKVIRPKEIKVDDDFFSGRDKKEMEDAMFAKFSQNEDLKKILLATKKAKLTHFVRGNPPVVFNELMRVRQRLN
jgi:DNA-binding transcriptional MerR regulator